MFTWTEYREIRKKYFGENRLDSKYNYKRYIEKQMKYGVAPNHTHSHTITDCFAPCTKAACPELTKFHFGVPVKKQEEENLMNYASATVQAGTTETQDQRKYLAGRLEDVYRAKRSPLEAQFGLIDDDAPQSAEDFKARISEGRFTLRDAKDMGRYFYNWTEALRWRDPAKKADDAGFEAARKELKAEKQKALDIIKIDEPKAGLDAIKALEAWKPTGAAN